MVDISKKDKEDDDGSKSKSSSRSSGGSSSGGKGSVTDTSPFSMGEDDTPNVEESSVPTTSQEWSEQGSELNTSVRGGESEREYIRRQVEECEEFYEDYADTAVNNVTDINQFTLYHHALNLSLARNRVEIMQILIDRFGYSEDAAKKRAKEICQEAGEMEAMERVLDTLTTRLRE